MGFKYAIAEITKFIEIQKSYQETMGKVLENLKEENQVVENNIKLLSEVNEQLSTNTVGFTEASGNLQNVTNSLGQTVEKSVDAIKSQGKMIETVVDSVEKQKNNIQLVNSSASEIVNKTQGIVQKLVEQNDAFTADTSKYLSTLNTSVEKTLEGFDEELSKGVKKLNGLFLNHDEAMSELEVFFSKISKSIESKKEAS